MHHYRLVFDAKAESEAGEISFQADCADRAFGIVRRHARSADLWVDGRHLCTMWHGGEDDYWVITSAADGSGSDIARAEQPGLEHWA